MKFFAISFLLCSCFLFGCSVKHKFPDDIEVDIDIGIDDKCFPCFPSCQAQQQDPDSGIIISEENYVCVASTAPEVDCSECVVGCVAATEAECSLENEVRCYNYVDGIRLRVPAFCVDPNN